MNWIKSINLLDMIIKNLGCHEMRPDKYRNWFIVSWISYVILLFIYEGAIFISFSIRSYEALL